MEIIIINKDRTFKIPERHQLSKENRRVVIKTETMTLIKRVLKGDVQETTDMRSLSKSRKTHKDLMEINGEFFKVERYKKDTHIHNDMVKLKCKRCDYEWEYNGVSEWYASCPKCRTTINVRKQKEEAEKKVRKTQKEVRVR